MKQLFYLFIVVITLLFTSCKKTSNNIEAPALITAKSYNEQVKYAQENLKQLGTEIGKLASDPDFVKFIHTEVSKKFDDEFEVLIKDLKENTIWGHKFNTLSINNSLKAFQNIAGSNYYPQIYIPKFQAIEDKDENASHQTLATPVIEEPIVYVFYAGDAEVDSATGSEIIAGYTTDANGNLVYWGMVDSAYANNHEVWIYSLNETVTNSGNLPCIMVKSNGTNNVDPNCDPGGGGGGGGEPPCTGDCDEFELPSNTPIFPELGHAKTNFKIEKMTIKDPKESWLSGAAEVSIRAKLHCHNNRKEGGVSPEEEVHYKSSQYSNLLGKMIRKFKRKEIKDQNQIYVNYPVETDWQYSNFYKDPIYCDFVIFERDAWPAKKNIRNVAGRNDMFQSPSNTTASWKQNYRSAERAYETKHFPYRVGTFCAVPNHTNFGLQGFSIDGANVLILGDDNSCTFNVIRY